MRVLTYVVICSGFFGAYFYIGYPIIHAIRIFPPLIVLIYLLQRIKLGADAVMLISFYSIYFVYTFISSLVNISNLEGNDLVNFAVLYLFVLSIILLASTYRSVYNSTFKNCIWIFILASVPVWLWEILTHHHLIYSVAADFATDYYFQPTTGFFVNANDFAASLTLSAMYLLGSKKEEGSKGQFLSWFLIVFTFGVCYTASSRLCFITFVGFLFFYFEIWRFRGVVAYIVLGTVVIASVFYFNLNLIGLTDFSVSQSESISQRTELYYHGLMSVIHSYGLGYGVLGHHYYYGKIAGLELTDPHNYILELLIDSGVLITVLYLLILLSMFLKLNSRKNRIFLVQFVLYNIILLSSSSSSFLWPHYFFFIAYFFQNEFEL